MYCILCGNQLHKDDQYCYECGRNISMEEKQIVIGYELEMAAIAKECGIRVTKTGEFEGNLNEYNYMYRYGLIGAGVYSILINTDVIGLFIYGMIGLMFAYAVKSFVATYRLYRLRRIEFALPYKADEKFIFKSVAYDMGKLGIGIIKNRYGSSFKDRNIDLRLIVNLNGTFRLRWRMTFGIWFINRGFNIPLYNKVASSMGKIAYAIQANTNYK